MWTPVGRHKWPAADTAVSSTAWEPAGPLPGRKTTEDVAQAERLRGSSSGPRPVVRSSYVTRCRLPMLGESHLKPPVTRPRSPESRGRPRTACGQDGVCRQRCCAAKAGPRESGSSAPAPICYAVQRVSQGHVQVTQKTQQEPVHSSHSVNYLHRTV